MGESSMGESSIQESSGKFQGKGIEGERQASVAKARHTRARR